MNKKDILELKRRFKKEDCTFTKMCGCYVNGEKEILLTFRETFLNLPDEAYFKYLDIAKKSLSGTIGNNLLELGFPLTDGLKSNQQQSLLKLRDSQLKDDALLNNFYQSIIDALDHAGNFLILLFHDAYDVITKTSDNLKLDESEEVYEYVLCAICPVALSKPGLSYFEREETIKPRIRDWIVGAPILGFTYPAFIDRSTDKDALMYYTKNAKDPHPELMSVALGCAPRQTATIQKTTFEAMIEDAAGPDTEDGQNLYMDIQESLNTLVSTHQEIYDATSAEPIALTSETIQEILTDHDIPEETAAKIEAAFEENFGNDLPLAESLLDTKRLEANAHKKKEEALVKQVEALEDRLEAVVKETAITPLQPTEAETTDALSIEADNDDEEDSHHPNIDVVLHVKPTKLPEIKTDIINGKRCIIVPIGDDERTMINGKDTLL